jgi:triacylglycerol lipase
LRRNSTFLQDGGVRDSSGARLIASIATYQFKAFLLRTTKSKPLFLDRGGGAPLPQAVLLLHGFGANRLMMAPMARHLKRDRFEVKNWGYSSIRHSLARHAQDLRQELLRLAECQHFAQIHLVAHSMGAIVAREALRVALLAPVGRLVMLAPPNAGSRVARRIHRSFGRLLPTLGEISDEPSSFVNRLGPPQVQVGVIAASEDWVVPLANTHLLGQQDHTVLVSGHTMLPFKRQTAEQVLHFLRCGRFFRTEHPYAFSQ